MRHLGLMALLATLLLSGCAALTKNMSQEPVDADHGSRTFGAFVEDGNIERKIKINLARTSADLDESHIVVVSFNGNVLLAGEVASDDLRVQAGNIAERVRHVRHVHNELKVSGKTGALARTNDSWLTTKVKSRLLTHSETPGWRTKVVTVNGVVYLMGLLSRAEADAVVAQVQQVGGVQKIVKIIEYIN
ncbi:BON domain-containing protein [Alloalcanivorax gelatiniphagus]|uniref:BON domain-containing protein n=1 Tax=Alloalcanivorax gelatiniphagus TaxID=1194167 RepID=A0ABY2XHA3_9GAMM|nr:BON domain-containing protein [Alloalcanivorax gelatiniphagus]TMW10527.1 BON domain-containing protein [Alloalcanivorax gelatiniphagus]